MSSYELDFFGRVRNLNEQALQAYLASDDARLSARNTLIAEIAMAWLQLGPTSVSSNSSAKRWRARKELPAHDRQLEARCDEPA